ncbi:Dolichyl-phosphate-mannose-protein mannosyltransferase [Paenibacillus sp. UNC496MF]|nr:Dolichyl-phosphate-mannose-protein mannosyltransferase [Paenibacillus sp. UNC496MF]
MAEQAGYEPTATAETRADRLGRTAEGESSISGLPRSDDVGTEAAGVVVAMSESGTGVRPREASAFSRWAAPAAVFLSVLAWAVYSWQHRSPFAASWDEVDFALALDRFDLLAMQPHFPGYPYFVLGAMALRRFVPDPVQAYDALNILMGALSVVPLWLLARRRLSPAWSLLAALLALTAPYLWLQSVRPMSEATGIAVLWWYLWSWQRAMERRTWGRTAAALFLFGVLMGVRLSFAPFGLGLVWLLGLSAADWRRAGQRRWPRVLLFAALAAGFQLLWLAGLALSEGGAAGFAKLALAFTAGHFSDWGGGVASAAERLPLAERLLRFAGDNVLWTGMFARSNAVFAAAAALLLAAVLAAGARPRPPQGGAGSRPAARAAAWLRRPGLPGALAALAGAYGAWALLAQNIDKPRHVTPLIGVTWLLLALLCAAAPPARPAAPPSPAAPGEASAARRRPSAPADPGAGAHPRGERIRRALRVAGAALAAGVVALQAARGAALVARQADEPPAVYRLAQGLGELAAAQPDRRFAVYTWEETRVLQYLRVPVANRRIETFAYFMADVQADPGATVLLTDHVLHGFEAQVGSLADKVKPIAEYRGDPLFEPVYHDITLYEWIGGR